MENVEKMKSGIPLTDTDRWDWLVNVREAAVDQLDGGVSGVVLTCSALKKKYRDVIRIARYNDHDVMIHFIFLSAPKEVLMQRVADRKGHFMKSSMVISQLQSLEEPVMERDVCSIDVSGTPGDVETKACDAIKKILTQDVVPGSNRTQ
jgi:gluconokinase